MGFELAAALAYERTRHAAELSPRLGQLLDAGMAVTVEIKPGSRRIISYLLSPVLKYKQESLRER